MPKKDSSIMSSIEMRNLIFDALTFNTCPSDKMDTFPRRRTFPQCGYEGCISDLRAITEYLAIKYELVVGDINKIAESAWGCPTGKVQQDHGTVFNEEEMYLFTEEVHLLLYQNILSPGALKSFYGDELPYFHVTQYGQKCLHEKDVLPYDPERYMKRIHSIDSIGEWEEFYLRQSLICYNAGAFDASMMMLGLAGEYLAELLVNAMSAFLEKHEPSRKTDYDNKLLKSYKISTRYAVYQEELKNIQNSYQELKELKPSLDTPATAVYATYLRLTRNGVAHPAHLKTDRMSCLTLIISYVQYCEVQHQYLDVLQGP